MTGKLFYDDVYLPENVDSILEQDFWILNSFSEKLLNLVLGPIKFESSVSIFVKSGSCDAQINLRRFHIEAPCMLNIRASQIIYKENVSPDFEAAFMVFSPAMSDNIMMLINDVKAFSLPAHNPVVKLSPEMAQEFHGFYNYMEKVFADKENPNLYKTVLYSLVAFFMRTSHCCYPSPEQKHEGASVPLTDLFIDLVQQNFRSERFLSYYAEKLGVTTRHLSRVVKQATGVTAGEWIERYVVLEAKVLLRSTNMSIQKISDTLNFPTQSFFGKYFKKSTGMSPKQYRTDRQKDL